MITRKQYLFDGTASHAEYFRQFVNEPILKLVASTIGIDAIKNSKDEHLNDIPLKKWDLIENSVRRLTDSKLLKETGEGWSSCTSVCIAKQAARILMETK